MPAGNLHRRTLTSSSREEIFLQFLDDHREENRESRIVLSGSEMHRAVEEGARFPLDFDDAYQYVAATSRGLKLVSFDDDFDRTDIERSGPQDVFGRKG